MREGKLYPTKPLNCWEKGKELTNRYWQEYWKSKDEGRFLGIGLLNYTTALPAAFGNTSFLDLGSYIALTAASAPQLAVHCIDTMIAKGYSEDICHAVLLIAGSLKLNLSPFGNFPRPDFMFQLHFCESQGKGAQVISDQFGIPYFCLDSPIVPSGEEVDEFYIEYVVAQLDDALTWFSKVTGQECDEEKLIEGLKTELEVGILWSKICALNQSVPAPLDALMLSSLSAPLALKRHIPETLAFYRELYEEVKEREEQGIAALATERCRVFHEGATPFPYIRLFRSGEQYGVVFLGSTTDFTLGGGLVKMPDGTWQVSSTLIKQCNMMKNREDALRLLARWWLENGLIASMRVVGKREEVLQRVRDWRIDAVVLHADRGCQALPAGMPEIGLALKAAGIPYLSYEGSAFNPREVDQKKIMARLNNFWEILGMNRSIRQ